MCTVVVRRTAGSPPQILALRDESTAREFDDPGRWWAEHPDLVGGRDRLAGGTWCATSLSTGATALVLNRPQKRVGSPGAPSRGVLPLLAAAHGPDWVSHVALSGMASFALVLAAPDRLITWQFDGEQVSCEESLEGTVMVTSGGPEDRKADRWLGGFAAAPYPAGWRALVQSSPPQDDPAALVVRHESEGMVYATVFGQLIEAAPGRLRCEYSRRPWTPEPWRAVVLGPGLR